MSVQLQLKQQRSHAHLACKHCSDYLVRTCAVMHQMQHTCYAGRCAPLDSTHLVVSGLWPCAGKEQRPRSREVSEAAPSPLDPAAAKRAARRAAARALPRVPTQDVDSPSTKASAVFPDGCLQTCLRSDVMRSLPMNDGQPAP